MIGVVVNPIGMTRAKFFGGVVKFLLSIGYQWFFVVKFFVVKFSVNEFTLLFIFLASILS